MFKEIEHHGKTHIAVDGKLFGDIENDWGDEHSEYRKSPDAAFFYDQFRLFDSSGLASNADFYQGTDEFFVIEERATGKLYGIPQWQGGGKYGELFRECNGDQFGLDAEENPEYAEHFTDEDFDEEDTPEYIEYWVFRPLKKVSYPAYELA